MTWYEKAKERVMREGLPLRLLQDGELSEEHYRAVAEGGDEKPAARTKHAKKGGKRRG